MTTTVVVDGVTITFGDTSGYLIGSAPGGDQNFSVAIQADVVAVGDANALLDWAVGGNDTLSGNIVLGDAFTVADHARGGDDVVSAIGELCQAYGDAETISGNAWGGDDSVSAFANFLSAAAYGDGALLTDRAHGGNDILIAGGSQHSQVSLFGDAGAMTGAAHGGDDVLLSPPNCSSAAMYGDAQTIADNVQCGNDTIAGPSAQLVPGHTADLFGDGEIISNNVQCGNDSLTAVSNTFSDSLYGDGQFISGRVHCGDDTLSGTTFLAVGSGVVTKMYGDGETLGDRAQGGNDVLISRSGDDLMWGDAAVVGLRATMGADRFVFSPQNGHDQVMDFQPGKDQLELDGFGLSSFQDLVSHFESLPDGVLISFDADDDILLRGVTVSQLSAGDFLFG